MRLVLLLIVLAVPLAAQPAMVVERAGETVADGGTDSMLNTGASPFNLTYTVRNDGTTELNLTGTPLVMVGDLDNCAVSVIQDPATVVPSGTETTLRIQVTPVAATLFEFRLTIEANDPGTSPYTFLFKGDPSEPESNPRTSGDSSECSARQGMSLSAILLLCFAAALTFRARHD